MFFICVCLDMLSHRAHHKYLLIFLCFSYQISQSINLAISSLSFACLCWVAHFLNWCLPPALYVFQVEQRDYQLLCKLIPRLRRTEKRKDCLLLRRRGCPKSLLSQDLPISTSGWAASTAGDEGTVSPLLSTQDGGPQRSQSSSGMATSLRPHTSD